MPRRTLFRMRKVLVFGLFMLLTLAGRAGADSCFIDPYTGIQTCPGHCISMSVFVTDVIAERCVFGHYEDSCTGETLGYWAACE